MNACRLIGEVSRVWNEPPGPCVTNPCQLDSTAGGHPVKVPGLSNISPSGVMIGFNAADLYLKIRKSIQECFRTVVVKSPLMHDILEMPRPKTTYLAIFTLDLIFFSRPFENRLKFLHCLDPVRIEGCANFFRGHLDDGTCLTCLRCFEKLQDSLLSFVQSCIYFIAIFPH